MTCFARAGIALAGELHKNFIAVLAAAKLNRGLSQTESIDAAIDRFKRLRHRVFLNLRDGSAAQSKGVTRRVAGRGRHIPKIGELRVHIVAEFREPR